MSDTGSRGSREWAQHCGAICCSLGGLGGAHSPRAGREAGGSTVPLAPPHLTLAIPCELGFFGLIVEMGEMRLRRVSDLVEETQ